MNLLKEANPYPPVSLQRLFELDKGGPMFTPQELTRIHGLAAVEADFVQKKNLHGRMPARDRIREQLKAYAEGKGPAPTQTLDQAAETAEAIRMRVHGARCAWFAKEARPFFQALFVRLLDRTTEALAEVEKAQTQQASALGLPYTRPPIVRSIERAAQQLHVEAERLADPNFSAWDISAFFVRKFAVPPPPEPVAAAA